MKNWLIRNKLVVIGIVLGAAGGFLYWQEIGCLSGTCSITSAWHNSTAYGALMGGLVFSMFSPGKKKSNNKTGE